MGIRSPPSEPSVKAKREVFFDKLREAASVKIDTTKGMHIICTTSQKKMMLLTQVITTGLELANVINKTEVISKNAEENGTSEVKYGKRSLESCYNLQPFCSAVILSCRGVLHITGNTELYKSFPPRR